MPPLDVSMAVEQPETEKWLTRTPDVLSGKTRVAGRRLSVHFIGKQYEQGLDLHTLAKKHNIDTAAVRAALEYYQDHPREMAAIDSHRERLLAEAEADPSIPTTPEELADFSSGARSASD